jgi:hypothetical protein
MYNGSIISEVFCFGVIEALEEFQQLKEIDFVLNKIHILEIKLIDQQTYDFYDK